MNWHWGPHLLWLPSIINPFYFYFQATFTCANIIQGIDLVHYLESSRKKPAGIICQLGPPTCKIEPMKKISLLLLETCLPRFASSWEIPYVNFFSLHRVTLQRLRVNRLHCWANRNCFHLLLCVASVWISIWILSNFSVLFGWNIKLKLTSKIPSTTISSTTLAFGGLTFDWL